MTLRRGLALAVDRAIAWRTGRRYPAYLAEFRDMETWPRERFETWRWGRLQSLLIHAATQVPYWQEVFNNLGADPRDIKKPEDLTRLPVLTKEIINARGARMHSRETPAGRITQSSTGGSSGRNVWFKIDADTHDRRRAAGRLTEEWDGVGPGIRLATLWGASLDQNPSRASRLYDRLTGRRFLSAYGVGDEQLSAHFATLERFRPEVVTSYPSILLHVARRWGRERCRRLGVRLIYCSAEALFPPVREELADLFGAVVRNRYASREFGLIAADDPRGEGMYLMDMRLFVELVPAVSPNAPAELLITDLDNRVMPLIRYAIEDLAAPLSPAFDGRKPFRKVASIEGRTLDVVVTPTGKAFGGTFFTLVLRPFDRSVAQFQVIQERPGHLRIKIVPGAAWDASVKTRLLERLAGQLEGMTVELEECAEIPLLPSGKRRFIVSSVPKEDPR